MTIDDRHAFGTRLTMLAEALNTPLSAVRIAAYFEALKDLPAADVFQALDEALRTSRFFPVPVEIRELVLGRPHEDADVAWGQILREVRRVGRYRAPTLPAPVLAAIEAVWGSWAGLCEMLPADGPELVGWAKQFKGAYATLARRAQLEPRAVAIPASLQAAMQHALKVVR